MKLRFILLTMGLLLISCAHYKPVQYVGGHRDAKRTNFETCTDYFLTFPMDAENSTVETAIALNKVKESDIYSIEQSLWPYLWPIYNRSCVVLNMNTNYKSGISAEVAPAPQSPSVSKVSPVEIPVDPNIPKLEVEPGVFTMGNITKDMELCDTQKSLARASCRKKIYNHYEKYKKAK